MNAMCSRRLLGGTARWLAAVCGIVLLLAACDDQPERAEVMVAGGDAAQGPELIRTYGCHSCHMVPGVRGADALVGPPLIHWSRRTYVAGMLPNTPDNLVAWIVNPQRINPQTAMPNMGVSTTDAQHIAAYLYTLR